ncbi:MAG: BsaWI family type II restriction enzyme [Candidatus Firestonebacteria bacterium]
MSMNLNEAEILQIEEIQTKYYMNPILRRIEKYVEMKKSKKLAWINSFDEIYKLMLESKDDVEKLLIKREKLGEIKSKDQARKSIAGSVFSNTIIFIFLKNKEEGNISKDIFITSKYKRLKEFEKILTIYVDSETQKPDCDLVIYKLKQDKSFDKCMILSLKTSLRERAGQTYKWKLLMEIASSDNEIKRKYNIKYNPVGFPLVAFATVNFYNEINNPQHRGMFKFFDKSFIAKNIDVDFINRMSSLVDFLKNW